MKKTLLVTIFGFISLLSFSQTIGYGGLIYDNSATYASIRPYVNARMNEIWVADNVSYYPVVGAGMNTLGNISISGGFDLKKYFSEKSNNGIFCGFSVDFLGWSEVYQDFMPSMRLGLESNKFILLLTNNWKFETILIEGQKAYEPNIKPTLGIFYKINGR
jgi:hypothetical protein